MKNLLKDFAAGTVFFLILLGGLSALMGLMAASIFYTINNPVALIATIVVWISVAGGLYFALDNNRI